MSAFSRDRLRLTSASSAILAVITVCRSAVAAPPPSTATPDVALDITQNRLDLLESTLTPGADAAPLVYFASSQKTETQFKSTFTGLVSDSSNVNQAPSSGVDTVHGNPDLETDYSRPLAKLMQLLVSFDLNTDRYPKYSQASKDEIWLQAQVAFAPDPPEFIGWNRYFYITDRASGDFNTAFSKPRSKVNDSSLGYSIQYYATSPSWKPSTAGNAGNLVAADINLGRRQAMQSTANGNFAKLKLTFSHVVNSEWTISVGATSRYTVRDTAARRDTLVSSLLLLKWTPVWMRERGQGEVDFTEAFNISRSTKSAADYNDNDLGPSLVARWTLPW